MRGLSPVAASGGHSSSRCAGLSLPRPLPLRSTGSRRAELSSCGSRAQLLRGMWDLPRPGLKPMSPASAGRFLTTVPPAKPPTLIYLNLNKHNQLETTILSSADVEQWFSTLTARWNPLGRLKYSYLGPAPKRFLLVSGMCLKHQPFLKLPGYTG